LSTAEGERVAEYLLGRWVGRAVAQAVSRWTLTVEARFRGRVEICGGQSVASRVFSLSSSVSPVSSIPPWFHTHYLGDEQWARLWPQFRDIVLHHRHEQQ
jgi:hypothetical protein